MYLENIKEYWNKRAKGYSEKSANELHSKEALFWTHRLEKFLPKNKTLNCLDIGCGPGFIGILLSKMGHKVTFCDYSENMLEEVKKNVQAENIENYTIKQADAQKLEFCDETFDLVINRNLIWNLEKPKKAYKEFLRVLKKDGKIIVFDGNHYLYKFDEKYLASKNDPKYKDPHTKEYMQGVDPNIMAKIAEDLPLSKHERPSWDINFFMKNKVTSIHTEPMWHDFLDENGKEKSVIEEFIICIEK